MPRLYLNKNGYRGEKINIDEVLNNCILYAKKYGWDIEYINKGTDYELLVIKRIVPHPIKNVYISAGIHGDEPASPLAVEKLLRLNEFPNNVNFWILPCLNPTGARMLTRENKDGIDINRDYLNPKTQEAKGHIDWLSRQPHFNLSVCVHEDWEANGFYIYSTNIEKSMEVVQEVSKIFPIEHSKDVDGFNASEGVIDVNKILSSEEVQQQKTWPEAFYFMKKLNSENYTLETSSDYTLQERVLALFTGLRALIHL